jgi:hypothetical protein
MVGRPKGTWTERACGACGVVKPRGDFYRGAARCKRCTCEAVKPKRIFRTHGVTATEYKRMLEKQGGVCAICKEPESRKQHGVVIPLCVDHDHATGKIRELLCSRCNLRVGGIEAQSPIAKLCRDYLRRHNSSRV